MNVNEGKQKILFDSIASRYQQHYGDPYSERYFEKMIFSRLVHGLDVAGKNALDAMCGHGLTSKYLRQRGAVVTGLDISEELLRFYKKENPGCTTLCASILHTNIPDNSFDFVFCVGGLHHVHPHVFDAVREIHRILRPGGYFCFAEPHAASLLDRVRKIWYRHDALFSSNESSLDIATLERDFRGNFCFKKKQYEGFGYLGYFFVFNSLILRIPLWLKKIYAPAFIMIEFLFSAIQTEYFSLGVIVQWQKISG